MRKLFIYCFHSGLYHCALLAINANIFQIVSIQGCVQGCNSNNRHALLVISLRLSGLWGENTVWYFKNSLGPHKEVRMREKSVAHLRCLLRWYKIMCCSDHVGGRMNIGRATTASPQDE